MPATPHQRQGREKFLWWLMLQVHQFKIYTIFLNKQNDRLWEVATLADFKEVSTSTCLPVKGYKKVHEGNYKVKIVINFPFDRRKSVLVFPLLPEAHRIKPDLGSRSQEPEKLFCKHRLRNHNSQPTDIDPFPNQGSLFQFDYQACEVTAEKDLAIRISPDLWNSLEKPEFIELFVAENDEF